MDSFVSAAKNIDLDRRLRALEQAFRIGVPREYDPDELVSLYVHAAKTQPPSLRDAALWSTIVLGLGVCEFVTLAQHIHDPFPWRPFLSRLDHLEAVGVTSVRTATAHLLEVARSMLKLQGFGDLVQIGDILASPTATELSLHAISVQKEPRHDQRLRRRKNP